MEIKNIVATLPVNKTKKPTIRKLNAIKKIVVHCTDDTLKPLELARYDVGPNHISSTGCPTCTYHYYINQAGEVYQLVDDTTETWHAGGHNSNSVAICLSYKTDPAVENKKKDEPDPANTPSVQMRVALQDLLVVLCKKLAVSPIDIFGHRELFGTGFILLKGHKALKKTCPGMTVDLELLRYGVAAELQMELKVKVDGEWGPKSEKAFRDSLKKLV